MGLKLLERGVQGNVPIYFRGDALMLGTSSTNGGCAWLRMMPTVTVWFNLQAYAIRDDLQVPRDVPAQRPDTITVGCFAPAI